MTGEPLALSGLPDGEVTQVCFNDERGTGWHTSRDQVLSRCDHNKFKKLIPLKEVNIALMRSAPGFEAFLVFAKAFEELAGEDILSVMPAAVTEDERESSDKETDPDMTWIEAVTADEEVELGKTSRQPDLPDSIFLDHAGIHLAIGEMLLDDE